MDVISGRVAREEIVIPSSFANPSTPQIGSGDTARVNTAHSETFHAYPGSDTFWKQLSPAEHIRQFNGLLEDGIITPEEFEKVKKRIIESI